MPSQDLHKIPGMSATSLPPTLLHATQVEPGAKKLPVAAYEG